MSYRRIKLKQLDVYLSRVGKSLSLENIPIRGWINTIRTSLGMTMAQLAKRINLSAPNVSQMEIGEVKGSVTLNTLKKAAEAMGCELVYVFRPKKSLEAMLRNQAQKYAEKEVGRVYNTMLLEAQQSDEQTYRNQIEVLADELIQKSDRRIWDAD